MVQSLWETVLLLLKKFNIELPKDTAILILGVYPRELKTCPHKTVNMNVHTIIIHNNQKVEMI